MNKLPNENYQYILDISLESLHQQSLEWTSDLFLWQDELDLFYNNLTKINTENLSCRFKEEIQQQTANLFQVISGKSLLHLLKEVKEHESVLGAMLLSNEVNENQYRIRHYQLARDIAYQLEQIKQVKREVLHLIKLVKDNPDKNPVLQVIRERRSVRRYSTRSVDPYLIDCILEAGREAPSALNSQPWKFYVLKDEKRIAEFSRAVVDAVQKNYKEMIKHAPDAFQGDDPIFHGAPVVIFVASALNDNWSGLNIGMCAQNMMLAAKAIGLSSCPIGLAQYVKDTALFPSLHLGDTEKVELAIALGYGENQPSMPVRHHNNVTYL